MFTKKDDRDWVNKLNSYSRTKPLFIINNRAYLRPNQMVNTNMKNFLKRLFQNLLLVLLVSLRNGYDDLSIIVIHEI